MVSAIHVFLFHICTLDIYNLSPKTDKVEILAANEIFLTKKVLPIKT